MNTTWLVRFGWTASTLRSIIKTMFLKIGISASHFHLFVGQLADMDYHLDKDSENWILGLNKPNVKPIPILKEKKLVLKAFLKNFM